MVSYFSVKGVGSALGVRVGMGVVAEGEVRDAGVVGTVQMC